MFYQFFVLIVLCSSSILEAKDFPSFLPRCYRNQADINECFLKATETIRPKLREGVKELGIPPIVKYVVPQVTFEHGSSSFNFKMDLTNLTIEGLDSYKFIKADINGETLRIELVNEFGPLKTASECYFQGHLLLANLNGHGKLLLDTVASTYNTTILGKLEKRNGEDFLKIANISVTLLTEFDGKAKFENFVGVNENVVKAINKVLEENSSDLVKEILPIFINFVEDFVGSVYKGVFDRFPFDVILPKSP